MTTFLIINFNKVSRSNNSKYNYNHADCESMNQYLFSCDFTQLFNPDETEFIKAAINNCVDMYLPKIPIKHANQPKWFNSHMHHIKINCLRTMKGKSVKYSCYSQTMAFIRCTLSFSFKTVSYNVHPRK